jgi:hypothetical protein
MASIMVMFPVLLVRHMVVQHTDYIKAILVFIVESHIMMWLQGRALAQREKGMNNNTQLKLFDKKGRSFDKHSDALDRMRRLLVGHGILRALWEFCLTIFHRK